MSLIIRLVSKHKNRIRLSGGNGCIQGVSHTRCTKNKGGAASDRPGYFTGACAYMQGIRAADVTAETLPEKQRAAQPDFKMPHRTGQSSQPFWRVIYSNQGWFDSV